MKKVAESSSSPSSTTTDSAPVHKPRIFVSCVSAEFRSARAKVADALRFLGYEPVTQEIFGSEPGDLRQVLRDKIAPCDGLLQIVGDAYGAEPPLDLIDPELGRVSYTQFEFHYAKSEGKRTWLVFAGSEANRDTAIEGLDLPHDEDRATRQKLQANYRKSLRESGHLYRDFSSHAELENIVLKLRIVAHRQSDKRQALRQILLGLGLFGIVALLAFEILDGRENHRISQEAAREKAAGEAIANEQVQQEAYKAAIRAHLLEASERGLDRDKKKAGSLQWMRRENFIGDAESAHRARVDRKEKLGDEMFSRTYKEDSTENLKEIIKIVAEDGVPQALDFLDSTHSEILKSAEKDPESQELILEPLLVGAELAEFESDYAKAESLLSEIIHAAPSWREPQFRYWEFLIYVTGSRERAVGIVSDTEAIYRQALSIAENLVESDPSNQEWQRALGVNHFLLSATRKFQDDTSQAAEHLDRSLSIRKNLAFSNPANNHWQLDLADTHSAYGRLLRDSPITRFPLEHFEKALEIHENLLAKNPDDPALKNAVQHSQIEVDRLRKVASDPLRMEDTNGKLRAAERLRRMLK